MDPTNDDTPNDDTPTGEPTIGDAASALPAPPPPPVPPVPTAPSPPSPAVPPSSTPTVPAAFAPQATPAPPPVGGQSPLAGGAPPRIAFGADGAAAVQPPATAPSRPFVSRIPRKFLVFGLIIAVLLGFGWWSSRGTTNADDLQAGDCFEEPDALSDIRDVTNQSCDGLHEAEIVAVTSLAAFDAYPGDVALGTGLEPTAADLACDGAIAVLDINLENVPADLLQGYFFADRREWDNGDRNLLCYASSASGIPGPLINR